MVNINTKSHLKPKSFTNQSNKIQKNQKTTQSNTKNTKIIHIHNHNTTQKNLKSNKTRTRNMGTQVPKVGLRFGRRREFETKFISTQSTSEISLSTSTIETININDLSSTINFYENFINSLENEVFEDINVLIESTDADLVTKMKNNLQTKFGQYFKSQTDFINKISRASSCFEYIVWKHYFNYALKICKELSENDLLESCILTKVFVEKYFASGGS